MELIKQMETTTTNETIQHNQAKPRDYPSNYQNETVQELYQTNRKQNQVHMQPNNTIMHSQSNQNKNSKQK